jgi:hypothetical protein
MFESIDLQSLGVLLMLLSVAAAIVFVAVFFSFRKPKISAANVSEWQPSGKIDFHRIDKPGPDGAPEAFLLMAEEYRTVESISGAEHTEISWRKATLAEAKSVVVCYQRAADPEAKSRQAPRLVHS